MGTNYKQLSLEERYRIAGLHEDGQSLRQIATIMGRAASSIAREIRRNSGKQVGYRPAYAEEQALGRRWRGSRLERDEALRDTVLGRLAQGWSPEQVAGRLAMEHGRPMTSYESIYRFIDAQIRRTKDYSWRHYLPRGKSKRGWRGRKGGSSVEHIRYRVGIEHRPDYIDARKQIGHWEADLMMFSNKKDNLLVAQERASRFVMLSLQSDKTAARVADTQERWFRELPAEMRRTLTQDNGNEFARHYLLNTRIGMKTYFCAPRSPWQKGGVENMNGRIRRYLPLNTDCKAISQHDLVTLQALLNATPRKCLGFKTPAELFSNQMLHFKCESTFPFSRG